MNKSSIQNIQKALKTIHSEIVRAEELKEVKRLCKEFGFTVGMLKGSLAEKTE